MKRRKRRPRAKDSYQEKILEKAAVNGGAIKLEEAAELIGTGKTYAWKLLQDLVKKDTMTQGGYGLYLIKKTNLK